MRIRPLLLLVVLTATGCEQAGRYPPPPKRADTARPAAQVKRPLPAHWSWMPAETPYDAPIVFVPATSKQWASLPTFWNADPLPGAGARTIYLGLPPLEAVSAYGMADLLQSYRIKVPAGLPDPMPLIPAANPPTYAKWRLGRDLFFAKILHSRDRTYACADCHKPDHGFAEPRSVTSFGNLNTPSLINAVYNRHQFWDGRAVALEEVVVRSLEDERPETEDPQRPLPEVSHAWGGLVKELAADNVYRFNFDAVFGIPQPTQDAIAKALATYMRTLLSGDSLYDRAEAQRQTAKAATLTSAHFLAALDDTALKTLGDGKLSKADAAEQLADGAQLFHGKANCAVCHHGPLFTDDDFHNIGVYAEDSLPSLDAPTGRIVTVPIGLKEIRLVGAYKTPSLRGLSQTGPYFHNGKRHSLREVVKFYDHDIRPTPYLAAPLRNGDREQNLRLDNTEIDALVLFLQSLDGTPLDPIVAAPPR